MTDRLDGVTTEGIGEGTQHYNKKRLAIFAPLDHTFSLIRHCKLAARMAFF